MDGVVHLKEKSGVVLSVNKSGDNSNTSEEFVQVTTWTSTKFLYSIFFLSNYYLTPGLN